MNVAVVGAGIFGLAAALEIRGRGHDVTVFEQGTVPYENATSTDVSKGIRRTWYAGDNETYVELVERAAVQWREWEARFDAPVYHQTGGLMILDDLEPGSPMHESVAFLRDRGANIEVLSAHQVRSRFPQFVVDDGEIGVYDPWAGYIESGRAVANLARLAREDGVEVREHSPVRQVNETGSGVRISLDSMDAADLDYDRTVVAAGVWVGRLLPEIGKHVDVTHQQMVLIEVEEPDMFAPPTFPTWSVDPDRQGWYGFPLLREGYVKVSNEPPSDIVDPDLDRAGTPEFAEWTLEFLRRRIPGIGRGTVVEGRSCLYASTPDDHFFVDWVPGHSRVLAAGGGSGHGFKFGGSMGQIIADALEDRANPMGDRFRIGQRFGSGRVRYDGSRGFARPATTSYRSAE